MTTERDVRWDVTLSLGKAGEERVRHVFGAMLDLREPTELRIEVKTDMVSGRSGRVYIEHECLFKGGWGPSGIETTEADLWAFVLPGVYVAYPVGMLRKVHAVLREQPSFQFACNVGSHPTRGVAVALPELDKLHLAEAWKMARAAGDLPPEERKTLDDAAIEMFGRASWAKLVDLAKAS